MYWPEQKYSVDLIIILPLFKFDLIWQQTEEKKKKSNLMPNLHSCLESLVPFHPGSDNRESGGMVLIDISSPFKCLILNQDQKKN